MASSVGTRRTWTDSDRVARQMSVLEGRTRKTVASAYQSALKDTRNSLAPFFEKYAVDGVLSNVEMAKFNRLKNLEEDLRSSLTDLGRTVRSDVRLMANVSYQESYYRNAWAVRNGAGVEFRIGALNRDAVVAAVQRPVSGITLNGTLRDASARSVQQVQRTVVAGITRGTSFTDMSRQLKDTLGKEAARWDTIIRTEGQRAVNTGLQDTYAQARARGIAVIDRWIATLDDRTREEHVNMDGLDLDLECSCFHSPDVGDIPGPVQSGIASFDINCRCTTIGIIPGFDPKEFGGQRRGKTSTGEYAVDNFMGYDDWRKTHGIPNTAAALGGLLQPQLTPIRNPTPWMSADDMDNLCTKDEAANVAAGNARTANEKLIEGTVQRWSGGDSIRWMRPLDTALWGNDQAAIRAFTSAQVAEVSRLEAFLRNGPKYRGPATRGDGRNFRGEWKVGDTVDTGNLASFSMGDTAGFNRRSLIYVNNSTSGVDITNVATWGEGQREVLIPNRSYKVVDHTRVNGRTVKDVWELEEVK